VTSRLLSRLLKDHFLSLSPLSFAPTFVIHVIPFDNPVVSFQSFPFFVIHTFSLHSPKYYFTFLHLFASSYFTTYPNHYCYPDHLQVQHDYQLTFVFVFVLMFPYHYLSMIVSAT
jgi:hypothetical protein